MFTDGGRNYRREGYRPAAGERDVEVQLLGPCLGELDCSVGSRDGKLGHWRSSRKGIQSLICRGGVTVNPPRHNCGVINLLCQTTLYGEHYRVTRNTIDSLSR